MEEYTGILQTSLTSLMAQMVKHLPTMREIWVQSLDREDPLEKEMATHSSTLTWKIPWMVEPGRLQSMGSQRVGHDWATSLQRPYYVLMGWELCVHGHINPITEPTQCQAVCYHFTHVILTPQHSHWHTHCMWGKTEAGRVPRPCFLGL